MKKCPFCAEEIQSEAIKCKHCGSSLNPSPKTNVAVQSSRNVDFIAKRNKIILVLVVIILIIYGCAKAFTPSNNISNTTPEIPAPQPVHQGITQTVFDISKLMGKSHNQIIQALGSPTGGFIPTAIQLNLDPPMSYTAEYKNATSGIELMYDYRTPSQPVRYFFLSSDNTSLTVNDYKTASNLGATQYKVVPQRVINGTGLTGIHVCDLNYKGSADILGSENCSK